jgi:hypothetical protein
MQACMILDGKEQPEARKQFTEDPRLQRTANGDSVSASRSKSKNKHDVKWDLSSPSRGVKTTTGHKKRELAVFFESIRFAFLKVT